MKRHTSRWRSVQFAVVVLFLAAAAANNGNRNLAERIDAWSEEKLARVERARQLHRAVIWSQRCERLGMDTLAKRRDREDWKIHCTPRRVLTVAAGG